MKYLFFLTCGHLTWILNAEVLHKPLHNISTSKNKTKQNKKVEKALNPETTGFGNPRER